MALDRLWPSWGREARHAGPDPGDLRRDVAAWAREARHAGPDLGDLRRDVAAWAREARHADPDPGDVGRDESAGLAYIEAPYIADEVRSRGAGE